VLLLYNGFCACLFLFSNVFVSDLAFSLVFNFLQGFLIHPIAGQIRSHQLRYVPESFSAYPDRRYFYRFYRPGVSFVLATRDIYIHKSNALNQIHVLRAVKQ